MDSTDEAGVPIDDVNDGDLDSTGAARPPAGDGKARAAVDSDAAADGTNGAMLNGVRAAGCGTRTVNTAGLNGSGRWSTCPSPGRAVPEEVVDAAAGGSACKAMSACPAAGASVSSGTGATTGDQAGALGRTSRSTCHPGGGSGGPSMRPPSLGNAASSRALGAWKSVGNGSRASS